MTQNFVWQDVFSKPCCSHSRMSAISCLKWKEIHLWQMKLMFKKRVYAHIFTSPGLVFSTLPPPTGKMLWCAFPAVLTHSPCGILQGHTKSLSSIKQTAKNDY